MTRNVVVLSLFALAVPLATGCAGRARVEVVAPRVEVVAPRVEVVAPPPPRVEVVAVAPQAEVVVEAPPPPPALVVEVAPPPPPSREHVWIVGYHRWDGARYVWTPGRYERRPRAGVQWRAARWENRGRGRVWIEGRWE